MRDIDYLIIEALVAEALDREENYSEDGSLIHNFIASDVYIESSEANYDNEELHHALLSFEIYQSSISKIA